MPYLFSQDIQFSVSIWAVSCQKARVWIPFGGDLGLSEGSRLEEAQPFGEPSRWGCDGRPSGGMELAAGVFEEGTEPQGPGVAENEVGSIGLCRLRFQPVLLLRPLGSGHLGWGICGSASVPFPQCCWGVWKDEVLPRAHPTLGALLRGEIVCGALGDTAGMLAAALSVPV